MKRFLLALLLCLPLALSAQNPILRNSMTTNNPGQVPAPLFTTTSTLFPLMVLNTGFTNQNIVYSPSFFMTGTNGFLTGILAAGGGKFSNSLTLNGANVLTNAPGSGITNAGLGTANTLAIWTDTNTLGNSTITDDGGGNFTFGSAGDVEVFFSPVANPNGDGTDFKFQSSDPGVDGRGGDVIFTAADGVGNGRGGNVEFRAGAGDGTGVPGFVLFEALATGGHIDLNAENRVEFSAPVVWPAFDNTTDLGTNGNRWVNVWSYGVDVDGDIRVSGNISPRDVPYIWPVAQGDTNTILVNDGTGVLSWEPRTNASVNLVWTNDTATGTTHPILNTNVVSAQTLTVTKTQTNTAAAISDIPLTLKGASGQTNDLQQWMSNAGTNYSKVNSNGQVLLHSGTVSKPSWGFIEDDDGTGTGMYRGASGQINVAINGASTYLFNSSEFRATTSITFSGDPILARESAGVLQQGLDAATPVSQVFKAHDGSGTDKAGADLSIKPGQGTGTGLGGTFYIATSKPRTTASTVNPYTNWFSIDSYGSVAVSNFTTTATFLVGGSSSNTLAALGVGTGLAVVGTNLTSTATASTWVPNTALAYAGGTNVTISGAGGTNFFLTVTNTTFFTTPTEIPASKTTNTNFRVYFLMNGTGGYTVTWTNGSFFFAGGAGVQFQPLTNANAMSYVDFSMSPFTNSIFLGDYGAFF